MADGDSVSANVNIEKQQCSNILCDIAAEPDFRSSHERISEDAITKMDSNKSTSGLGVSSPGRDVNSPNSDLTKLCKDTNNTIIHSIVNSRTGQNDLVPCINPNDIGNGSRSPGANLSSLSQLCAYDSDSDHSVSELSLPIEPENVEEVQNNYNYRSSQPLLSDSAEDSEDSDDYIDDSSSTTSSSTESSSSSTAVASSDDSDSDSDSGLPAGPKPDVIRNDEPKTKGEISIGDLPPIEDLHISVPEEECTELGHIENIVDTLVVVQAKKNSPALDLDSVLFLDKGKRPLGRVFDVFGPVTEPCYCVRFNSVDHINQKQIGKGMAVFCAPRSEFSSYVFLPDLLKMKGSDASWEFNNEPPQRFLDYSDDEEERRARRGDKGTNKEAKVEDPDQPSRKRRTKYEQVMNSRNLRMSAIHPPVSTSSSANRGPWGGPFGPQRGASIFSTPPPTPPPPPLGASSPSILIRPPSFNVPPPSFGTTPASLFSSPPPPFPPVGAQSSREEVPLVLEFDPSLPPPPPLPSQFNFPPPTQHRPENLPPHAFQIPPPPPPPSSRPQINSFSSPPPQPPPAHW